MVTRGRLAIIPARGGSKRLPRKNILDFGGKPMIAWTIEAAISSGLFDRVIVSTEDAEIADVAIRYGVDVPFRREQHVDDHAPVSAATLHAVTQTEDMLGESHEIVVQLMANCPLRSADDIRAAMAAFERRCAPFQISCVRFGWLNPWWARRLDSDGHGEMLFPEQASARSQDIPPLHCPTGAIWIAKRTDLLAAGTFHGADHRFEPMPLLAGIDIDDSEDLDFARAALAMKQGGHGRG